RRILEAGAQKVIVATETLESVKQLEECIKSVGRQKILGSLDYKEGKILTKSAELIKLNPVQAAQIFERTGVSEIIFLELSKVGTLQGVEREILKKLIEGVNIPILTGGGIESIQEVIDLQKIGVAGVLIATALHKGKIRPEDLQKIT
ncbi:MAG: HisA/HisF-related TIM barrel protein, partial [Candidatus Jordarchaeaceae archaeon]